MPQPTVYSKIFEWIEGRGSRNPSKIIQKFNQKSSKKNAKINTDFFMNFHQKTFQKWVRKASQKASKNHSKNRPNFWCLFDRFWAPKYLQNPSWNPPENDAKNDTQKHWFYKPVWVREREARSISNRAPSVASIHKLSKRQSLRSLASCARSRAALATGCARIP